MKMTDATLSNVYDLVYPSPIPLKNTIAISVAKTLWQEEIKKYRANNTLNKLYLYKKLSMDSLIPHLPSTILDLIRIYLDKFDGSLVHWLDYHYPIAFKFHHNDHNEVLRDFDDFVCDFDGSIDFCKTARRIMLCDRFSDVEKFIIACKYFLENDAKKLWQSVKLLINLNEFDLAEYRYLDYWVNRLSDGPNSCESSDWNIIYSKELLLGMRLNTATTVEYFWNVVDSAFHVEVALQSCAFFHADKFCRFVLPRLNEDELDKFMAVAGDELIPHYLGSTLWISLVIPVWRLVRSKITESNFLCAVRKMLEKQSNYQLYGDPDTTSCHEIWENAPDRWKRLVIKDVLQDSSLFVREYGYYSSTYRQSELLFMLLSEATIEERKAFWNKNWSTAIVGMSLKDLNYIMKLCIADPDKIDLFKEMELSNYDNIVPCCIEYMGRKDFQKLDEFLIFCGHHEEFRKYIKSRLLYEHLKIGSIFKLNSRSLDEFIKSAFYDEDKIIEYKDYLSRTLAGNADFLWNINGRHYRQVMEFVDIIVLSEEVAVDLKESVFPNVIRRSLEGSYICQFKAEDMSNFLHWCFADDEKISKFKQSLPIEKIVRAIKNEAIAENKRDRKNRNFDENSKLDEFLIWYFTSIEAVAEFKTSLPDIFEGIDLLNHLYL